VIYPTLETERLILRPLERDDLQNLAALHAEESFWWYPFRRGWSTEETATFIERTLSRYDEDGCAVSAIVVPESGRLAGWAGLSVPRVLPEVLPAVEVGWRLGEAFRGLGYATEAGGAWVDHGFASMGLDEIVSIYEPENRASGAVMNRLGFQLKLQTVHPREGMPIHVTALTRDAWRDNGGDGGAQADR
jgi:RimJ/RimL family protein N-acetyltransferase